MKAEIHPEYVDCVARCACGAEFETRSTKEKISVEMCSQCHPFYTGKEKLIDTAGRVERFRRKYAAVKPKAKKAGADALAERAEIKDKKTFIAGNEAKRSKEKEKTKADVAKIKTGETTKLTAGTGVGNDAKPGGKADVKKEAKAEAENAPAKEGKLPGVDEKNK